MNKVIELGRLNYMRSILDFGCGDGKFGKILGDKVIGFDIDKNLTQVDDYTTRKYEIILCNHVLEHMTVEDIKEALNNFTRLSRFLVVGSPTENVVAKLLGVYYGSENHRDHRLKLYYINELISEKYDLLKKEIVMTMTEVSFWQRKQ